jgi:hypothetical protein
VTFVQAQPDRAGRPLSLELTVASREKLQIGPCTYDVLTIRNRYLAADGKVRAQHTDFYSPDLAFVIGRRFDQGGGRETSVKYETIQPLARRSPL